MSHETAGPLSVPRAGRVPRPLTSDEHDTLVRVANALIPGTGPAPAAADEPGFPQLLAIALDARADAFDAIVRILRQLSSVPSADLLSELEALADQAPSVFQALSTVLAGAWLLTPGVRDRIGYHGPRSDRAGIEDAVDELETGILAPVLDQDHSTRWIR